VLGKWRHDGGNGLLEDVVAHGELDGAYGFVPSGRVENSSGATALAPAPWEGWPKYLRRVDSKLLVGQGLHLAVDFASDRQGILWVVGVLRRGVDQRALSLPGEAKHCGVDRVGLHGFAHCGALGRRWAEGAADGAR